MTITVEDPPADFVGVIHDATGLTGPELDQVATEIWNMTAGSCIPEVDDVAEVRRKALNEDLQAHMDLTYRRRLAALADRLRELAESVETFGTRLTNVRDPGVPDYSRAARDVVHEVMWGLANAHLDAVVEAASDADRVFRNPE